MIINFKSHQATLHCVVMSLKRRSVFFIYIFCHTFKMTLDHSVPLKERSLRLERQQWLFFVSCDQTMSAESSENENTALFTCTACRERLPRNSPEHSEVVRNLSWREMRPPWWKCQAAVSILLIVNKQKYTDNKNYFRHLSDKMNVEKATPFKPTVSEESTFESITKISILRIP